MKNHLKTHSTQITVQETKPNQKSFMLSVVVGHIHNIYTQNQCDINCWAVFFITYLYVYIYTIYRETGLVEWHLRLRFKSHTALKQSSTSYSKRWWGLFNRDNIHSLSGQVQSVKYIYTYIYFIPDYPLLLFREPQWPLLTNTKQSQKKQQNQPGRIDDELRSWPEIRMLCFGWSLEV